MILIFILIATGIVSLFSLIGIFFIFLKEKVFNKLLFILVSFAGGALIGGSFLHLFPHSLENFSPIKSSWIFIIGFVSFFLLERILRWRHCHEFGCKIHPVSYLNLIGDSLHNFIDGVIIAASFLKGINFGIVTTIIVIAHEIPQEIGDYAILVYGGMKKIRALFLNFISALTSILGGILGFYFLNKSFYINYVIPFAAGNFFYISASDLVPEFHKEINLKRSFNSFIFFILGIILIYLIKIMFPEVEGGI
jgi:zinc and cadmium transporter